MNDSEFENLIPIYGHADFVQG